MKVSSPLKLIVAIVISELAGVVGSFFTAPNITTWYAVLAKPFFNPPAWVFAPVWTTLFLLMGISAYLIWVYPAVAPTAQKRALEFFSIQLILNILWSVVFFGFHSPGAALWEIIFLWLAIISTMVAFYKISKLSAYLLVPYIVWVSFAILLNFAIWKLN